MTAKARSQWRNRIVGRGEQPADQFVANPDNYRIHPTAQQEALAAVLERVGWVDEVIVNRTTGNVVNGHLRIMLALQRGDRTPVPYREVELTPAEEALVLASFDPISALAGTDQQKLEELFGLLPEAELEIARLVHAEKRSKKRVEFDAEAKHLVVVECEDARKQSALRQRLEREGYKCRDA